MYLRAVHAEFHIPSLRAFVRNNPLGLFITAIQPSSYPQIQCTHLPWILDVNDEGSETELGRLRGHMARQNPHAKALIEAIKAKHPSNGPLELEVSVVFNGPAHSYVTPKFYTQTKPDTGKVVPTWNYSAVQAYGNATIYFDTNNESTSSFLETQIDDLTKHSEVHVMDYSGGDKLSAWEVSDAPANYIHLLKKSIIGIDIEVTRLEGKYKMSQEMGVEDRQGVIQGFEALGTESGSEIAKTVQERGALKDAKASK